MRQLADWWPTFTGGPGHTGFVNWIDKELRAANLTPQRKTFKLPYWELKKFGLNIGCEQREIFFEGALEHLGAMGWKDDVASNSYKPTGEGEWGRDVRPVRGGAGQDVGRGYQRLNPGRTQSRASARAWSAA